MLTSISRRGEAQLAAGPRAEDLPLVGWAERGGYDAQGHGNSVPRFHITWGTGPALVDIFVRQLRDRPTVRFAHRHQVDKLIVEGNAVTGVRGTVLEPSDEPRGAFVAKVCGEIRVSRVSGDRRQWWYRWQS